MLALKKCALEKTCGLYESVNSKKLNTQKSGYSKKRAKSVKFESVDTQKMWTTKKVCTQKWGRQKSVHFKMRLRMLAVKNV